MQLKLGNYLKIKLSHKVYIYIPASLDISHVISIKEKFLIEQLS